MGNEAQVNHETGCRTRRNQSCGKFSFRSPHLHLLDLKKPQNYKIVNHIWEIKSWRWLKARLNVNLSLSVCCKKFLYLFKLATGKSRGRSRFWFFKSFIFDSSAHTTTRWSCWSCKGRVWAVKKWMRKQTKKNKKILAAFH